MHVEKNDKYEVCAISPIKFSFVFSVSDILFEPIFVSIFSLLSLFCELPLLMSNAPLLRPARITLLRPPWYL